MFEQFQHHNITSSHGNMFEPLQSNLQQQRPCPVSEENRKALTSSD